MKILGAILGTAIGLITGLSFFLYFSWFIGLYGAAQVFSIGAIPALLTFDPVIIGSYAALYGGGLLPFIIGFLLASLGTIVITSLVYLLVKTALPATPNNGGAGGSINLANSTLEELCRGVFIGITLGSNYMIIGSLLAANNWPLGGSIFMGIVLLLIILSLFMPFTTTRPALSDSIYKGIYSWFGWVVPTCWIVNAVGLLLWFLSFIYSSLGVISIFSIPVTSPGTVGFDWTRGVFLFPGGFGSSRGVAYNLGHFIFSAPPNSPSIPHEEGHTLNLISFGWVFHFAGAIDQAAQGGSIMAYSELLAESERRNTASFTFIPMW
jgi:MFS family permease